MQRIYDDFRHCQIEPWLDSEEIRHGQPWLDAIFEGGIPTCNCVLVYLTPNSIESALVKKEIDASIISKLRDNHIAFLPYVSHSELRVKLRPDIQALQTPEWNEANYHSLLPRVVAEVWRSFMERTVLAATSAEKVRRLEAELEVGRLKSQQAGPFAEGEDRDFRYIWNALDRWEPVIFQELQDKTGYKMPVRELTVVVRQRSILPFLAGPNDFEHNERSISHILREHVQPSLLMKESPVDNTSIHLARCPDLTQEFLMFGLIERRERPQRQVGERRLSTWLSFEPKLYTLVYTQKMERFKYWLAFNGLLPKEIEWSKESEWSAEQPAEPNK